MLAVHVLGSTKIEKQNIEMVRQIRDTAQQIDRIDIHWIPSHIGREGNEKADELAKLALSTDSIDRNFPLTANQLTTQQRRSARELMHDRALEMCKHNTHLAWLHRINELQPWLDRPTLHKSSHSQLNALGIDYRPHTYGGISREPAICKYCTDSILDPIHYLVLCPALEPLRRELVHLCDPHKDKPPHSIATDMLRYVQQDPKPIEKMLKLTPFLYH